LREYNLGCTLKELFYKCEWWEILGLLYASYEDQVLKRFAAKKLEEEAIIEQKIRSGKIKGIYRPDMSKNLRNKITGGQ
jgi:hypothetical protein